MPTPVITGLKDKYDQRIMAFSIIFCKAVDSGYFRISFFFKATEVLSVIFAFCPFDLYHAMDKTVTFYANLNSSNVISPSIYFKSLVGKFHKLHIKYGAIAKHNKMMTNWTCNPISSMFWSRLINRSIPRLSDSSNAFFAFKANFCSMSTSRSDLVTPYINIHLVELWFR